MNIKITEKDSVIIIEKLDQDLYKITLSYNTVVFYNTLNYSQLGSFLIASLDSLENAIKAHLL